MCNENNLKVFNFANQYKVRCFVDSNQCAWWVAKDVCDVLGIKDHKVSLRGLDEDEKGECITPTPGGPQQVTTINEPGLYTLILRSRKPEAKAFRRWITHEVIPAIRRTGQYAPFSYAAYPTEHFKPVTSINDHIHWQKFMYRSILIGAVQFARDQMDLGGKEAIHLASFILHHQIPNQGMFELMRYTGISYDDLEKLANAPTLFSDLRRKVARR
jgi:prophage antirepressor-like protein